MISTSRLRMRSLSSATNTRVLRVVGSEKDVIAAHCPDQKGAVAGIEEHRTSKRAADIFSIQGNRCLCQRRFHGCNISITEADALCRQYFSEHGRACSNTIEHSTRTRTCFDHHLEE